MITQLTLKNFKCYQHQSFDFGKLTIFCGNNSVGKSTAIQGIAIPFQSKFARNVTINGDLVTLGSSADIFSRNARDGDESLNVELCIKNRKNYSLSWGFDDFNEQIELKNHLAYKSKNSQHLQAISKYYFKSNGFQFIEAERFGPREYFNINRTEASINWLGSKGQYSYEVYSSLDEAGIRLSENDLRTHTEANKNSSIRRNINYWMSEISPGFSIESEIVKEAGVSYAQFQAFGSGKTIPLNMGFGLSYALSVVIALLVTKPGGLVIIENPEAHLHPRGQSYLGRLIALTALSGIQVIIETHSDHLLNGLRVIARLNSAYEEGDFKVYYVSSTKDNQSSVDKIDIGNKGELSKWPEGFFDQQAYDLKTIIKGEDVNNIGVRK
ncbi:DUF3696 domain-containing protein [Pectobacterium polaris]|uniref:DUF3696 domain-containing protein n=1 Tax=Pectobacterium polaris TaxID=2042057 RepID=UPI0023B00784|nr:DUF3696 domain-containing protein [Pectobacterium polaris]MDE8740379.1 DUF3696 domain-containing protein [Pectobacterium polaris]